MLVVRSIGLFILAAYGGIFIAGSLAWGAVADGYRPDRSDIIGALICLVGVGFIMYAPATEGPARGRSARAGRPEAGQTSMTTGMIMGRRR